FAQAFDDSRKGVTLDEIEQLFLGLEVVIEPGQRDAAQPRQVAHRRPLVALAGEDLRGAVENLCQTAVKAGIAVWRTCQRARRGSCGHGRCWVRSGQPDTVGCRTFVRLQSYPLCFGLGKPSLCPFAP